MALTKITSTNIGANAVTNTAIGYTPANKAGDTFTGNTTVTDTVVLGGTTIPDSSRVTVNGAKVYSGGIPQQQLNVYDSTAIAAGVGGAISFSANYVGASPTTMGSIEGVRENATSGNYAGNLIFKTRVNGGNNTEVMRIDSAGRITIPYQPRFHATGNGGSSTSGGLAQFPTVKENIGSYYSNSTMRFTAPIAGTYFFYGAMMASTGTGRMIWKFYKNGSSSNGYMQAGGDSTNYGNWPAAMIMTLAVNDYITMVVEAGTTYNSNQEQYFGGYLIG